MSRTIDPDPDPAVPSPPSAATLGSLPADEWAALLPAVRAGFGRLDDHAVTPVIRRLRAAPTGRLAGGRVRRELCDVLSRGGAPWAAVVEELEHVTDLPPALEAIRRGDDPAPPAADPPADPAPSDREVQQLRVDAERARARAREAREEREASRRRAETAERRALTAEARVAELETEVASLLAQRTDLERSLDEAEDRRRRAVDRESRRREGEIDRLRGELATLRRAAEEHRLAARRREESRQRAEREARQSVEARRAAEDERGSRVRPGRPSVLPEGVAADTAEAADLLLHAGRLVLVDGYNLSLHHRGHLPLEMQRSWLTRLLATAAAQRRIRPVVVFDGERAGGGRPITGSREVEVRFTPSGITADDELVLAVEATDEPVLVVTDDRELAARVRASGADVVGTGPFLWALS